MASCADASDGTSHEAAGGDEPNEWPGPHERLRASIRAHSSSVTGMTESLADLESGTFAA